MITWAYFRSVKRLKVDQWMKNRDIKSYDDLVDRLTALGVEAPPLSEVESYFPKPKIVEVLPETLSSVVVEETMISEVIPSDVLEVTETKKKKKKTKESIVESFEVTENEQA